MCKKKLDSVHINVRSPLAPEQHRNKQKRKLLISLRFIQRKNKQEPIIVDRNLYLDSKLCERLCASIYTRCYLRNPFVFQKFIWINILGWWYWRTASVVDKSWSKVLPNNIGGSISYSWCNVKTHIPKHTHTHTSQHFPKQVSRNLKKYASRNNNKEQNSWGQKVTRC